MAVIEAIFTTYLEADTNYIKWDSIPSTYEHLEVVASIQMATSSSATGTGCFFLQNDHSNGSNYARHMVRAQNSTVGTNNSATHNQSGHMGSQLDQTTYAMFRALIPNYTNTTTFKMAMMVSGMAPAVTYTPTILFGSLLHYSDGSLAGDPEDALHTVAIAAPGATLTRGSCATLYGWKSA